MKAYLSSIDLGGTVDGRNPAPVDMLNIPFFTRSYTSQVVVWDFFHQQYTSWKDTTVELTKLVSNFIDFFWVS